MQVRVIITDEWGAAVHDAALSVDRHLFQDAAKPIDFPSEDAGAISKMLCTWPKDRDFILGHRKQVAAAITESLMAFFESRDTEMGYSKR